MGFILVHTTWSSFRCLWGSSPARPWKVGKRCISPYFNSKVVVASKVGNVMHKGYWFKSGAASSFKVWFSAMTSSSSKSKSLANRESRARLCSSEFFLASLLNLRKVLFIYGLYCKSPWLEDRVTVINNQGNSNNLWKINKEKSRVMKINQNSMLKHKKRLKPLENNGIWPRKGGASNP